MILITVRILYLWHLAIFAADRSVKETAQCFSPVWNSNISQFSHPITLISPLWPTFHSPGVAGALKEQAVALLTHISRELFILPRSGTILICVELQSTQTLGLTFLSLKARPTVKRGWERQRIKHGTAAAFDLPFPPFSLFQRTSEESSSWCRSWGPINLPPAGTRRWMARGLFIFILVWCDSKKVFFGVLFHAG